MKIEIVNIKKDRLAFFRKNKKIIEVMTCLMIFTIGFGGILVCTNKFWVGFHNADGCQNYEFIIHEYNTEMIKNNLSEKVFYETSMNSEEPIDLGICYKSGLSDMFSSFKLGLFFSMFFSLGLMGILYEMKGRWEK